MPVSPATTLPARADGGSPALVTPTTLSSGLAATALSLAALAWRGRADAGSAAAPLNAVSHMLWGDESLRRDDATARHTAVGGVLHAASALFWARVYDWVRAQRAAPTATSAVADAAVLTLVAAVVDLKLVPRRLTPGFERRLTPGSLTAVYAAIGAGLAAGGWLASRRGR